MNNQNRKRMSAVMGIAAAAVLTVGSLAYFTDRATGQATATSGTLGLELTETWDSLNAVALVPGDKVDFDYTLSNTGNKAMDVKEQIVITSPVQMSGEQAEFELYAANDVEQDAAGAWQPKGDAKPVATRSLSPDGKKVTYDIAEFQLQGTGNNAQTDVGTAASKTGDYVIVFKAASSNAFQGQTITVDYLAQAKQHDNTNADTWTTVQSETITFAGDSNVKVVPAKN